MNLFVQHSNILKKVAISAVIMAVLFLSMDFSKFTASVGRIHIDAWILALSFIYFQILALSVRWYLLINVYGKKIDFPYAVNVNLMSLIANYLFITSVGGIVVRVAMSVKSGVSLIRSIAATGLDRFFTLLALILLAVIFLPVFGAIVSQDIYHNTLFLLLFLFGSSCVFSLFIFEKPRKKIIFSHRKVAMCFQYLRKVLTNRERYSIKPCCSNVLFCGCLHHYGFHEY